MTSEIHAFEKIIFLMLLLSAAILFVSCGRYTTPPNEFLDSSICYPEAISASMTTGTTKEFADGLILMISDDGTKPTVKGWTKKNNIYTVHFAMKGKKCTAVFRHILSSPELEKEQWGKVSVLESITVGSDVLSGGMQTSTFVLLAIKALGDSGVETSIDKKEKERKQNDQKIKAEQEKAIQEIDKKEALERAERDKQEALAIAESEKKSDEYEKQRETLNDAISNLEYPKDESKPLPRKYAAEIRNLIDQEKIKSKADLDQYMSSNGKIIEDYQAAVLFIEEEFSGDYQEAALRDETVKKLENGDLKTVDEIKTFLKSKGRDPEKTKAKRELAEFVDQLEPNTATSDLEIEVNSGKVTTLEDGRQFLATKGVDLAKLDAKLAAKKLKADLMAFVNLQKSKVNITYDLTTRIRTKIEAGEIKSKR